MQHIKDIFKGWLDKKGWGYCYLCKKLTNEKHQFCDDVEQEENGNYVCSSAYWDFCHDECFEENKSACV